MRISCICFDARNRGSGHIRTLRGLGERHSKQLFASKYVLYLPTEEELEQELKRERQRIEERGGSYEL
jgi:hypothetical protein